MNLAIFWHLEMPYLDPLTRKWRVTLATWVGGMLGMINAVLATVVPSIILVILLLTVLNAYKDKPWVSGMSQAVVPVVAVMLGTLTWDFYKKSAQSNLGKRWTVLLIIGSFILLQLVGLHPAIIIFALLIGALALKNKNKTSEPMKKVLGK